jgi:hypothetical protein
VIKYTSWRDYASQNSTTSDELTELLSSKFEFFQTLDQFWLELEEGRRDQEESAEDMYRMIIS